MRSPRETAFFCVNPDRKLQPPRTAEHTIDLGAPADMRSRMMVRPGATLLLRFTPGEERLNLGLATFFTFGIRELTRN